VRPNAKGNQRRPLNYGAINEMLLPAGWLTRLCTPGMGVI